MQMEHVESQGVRVRMQIALEESPDDSAQTQMAFGIAENLTHRAEHALSHDGTDFASVGPRRAA
jgi:hypothetical protein